MRSKYIIPVFAAFCLLTGCGGKKVSNTVSVSVEVNTTSAVTTSVGTSAAAVTSKPVTTTTTAAAKPEPPKDLVLKGKDSVEVYEEIKLKDFITEKNVDLKDGDVLLNTSDTGVYEVEIPYIYGGNEFTQKLQYSVIDTTAPIVLNAGWTPYHKVGTPFDLNNYVGFADNFDKAPTLTYEGDVDPNAVGDYPLTATATDSSGNSVSWDLTISVVDQVPAPVDNNPRVDYSSFIERYDQDGVRFGIDVSAWQTNVDYNAVRDAGCSFVIIRIGYYYSQITMDDYFRQNIENATAAGLDVGVYFYTTDNSEEGVREHARWIADNLNGQQLDFPVAFDWEEFGNFQKYGMSIKDLNDIYAAFADEMEKCGYSAMLYSSKNFLNNFWSERTKTSHPVWLAHFVDETDYEGDYAIWQASAYGHIPGIVGDVDMDIQYLNKSIH